MTAAAPPPQQPSGLDDPALPLAVATALVTATSAAVAIATLTAGFALSAAAVASLSAVLGDVMSRPPPVTGVIGAASEQVARQNAARRAQYVIAASKRVLTAAVQARAHGTSARAAMIEQLDRERNFYQMHQRAMWQRAAAAGKTDMAALEHGNLLGWLAVNDKRTSPECKAASGKNYYASRMPDIGYPGSAHVSCRCLPSAPWPGAPLLPGSAPRYARAA